MNCIQKCNRFALIDETCRCIFDNSADRLDESYWIKSSQKNEFICKKLIDSMQVVSINEIKEIIINCKQCDINASNIPQFSNFDNGTTNLISRLRMAGDFGPSYVELGEQFLDVNKKSSAYRKYGENHAKLAELLGLVYIDKNKKTRIYLTQLGKCIETLPVGVQNEIIEKLVFRIPIIKSLFKNNINDSNEVREQLCSYLSPSTANRRRSNVIKLLKIIENAEKGNV